jgi:hypothetical protein
MSLRRARAATCLLVAALAGAAGSRAQPTVQTASQAAAAPGGADAEQQARTVCGGCHAFPTPDILPRSAWRDEFVRMKFIRENRLPPIGPPAALYPTIPLPPDMEAVLPYYVSRAPERLPAPEPWPEAAGSPVRLERTSLTMADMPGTPAVAHVQLVDLDGDKQMDVLGTDMRQGVIFRGQPANPAAGLSVVASIPHPARVTLADVDADGLRDLLVGDMGEFFPADHQKGAVIWLRGLAAGKFGAFWLDGWPRVADVQAADFNGDGKNDLAVAAFGWRKTGQIAILENRTASATQPSFETRTVDPRPGGIRTIPVDLDRDGRMDVIALLAQEHESVLAYVNKGGFAFDRQVIYAAPHPNWGSSGVETADMDADGDVDVLLTHGDTFDDGIVKPYHGIQWLENTGTYPFVAHTIAQMPGVHGAKAVDFDGDGDLDIVAGALLAGGSDVDEKTLPALVWLEQTKRGTFARHTIEMGFPRHATVDAGDVDGDGDADVVAGTFAIDKSAAGWVDVWVNQGKK